MLGGGGGHHHGGRPGGWIGPGPGWWGGPYYDPGVQIFTIDDGDRMPSPGACPKSKVPVLASDGLVYDNACYARAAGVKVVKQVAHQKTPMKGYGMGAFTVTVDDQNVTPGFWIGVAVGAIGTSLLRAILR